MLDAPNVPFRTISAQPQRRCRTNDGLGKSDCSWEKHVLLGAAMHAQAAKMRVTYGGGRGILIDMHAHNGEGVTTPQGGLFPELDLGTSSAALCIDIAHTTGSDVILCERHPARRKELRARFGRWATCISNHRTLVDQDLSGYRWALVVNDPNGPSEHGVETMQWIATQRLRTDFFIMVNEGAIRRILGLRDTGDDDHHKNAAAIKALREKKSFFAWMLDPDAWRQRLSKREIASSRQLTNGKAYRGRLHVVTNSLANLNKEMFSC